MRPVASLEEQMEHLLLFKVIGSIPILAQLIYTSGVWCRTFVTLEKDNDRRIIYI